MIISAINRFNQTSKNNFTYENKSTLNLKRLSNISTLSKDTFVSSKNSTVSFGVTLKEFPFDKKTLDFIIPNKTIRRVKPNIAKIIHPVEVPATDGSYLKSWFIEPKGDKPVFHFLNGTNYNKTHQDEVVKFFDRNGYGALMIDYRGFGESLGTATEKSLYEDAESGLNFLNKLGLKDNKLVLWGYSMGGAIARHISRQNEFRCGIIDSSIKHEYAIKKHFLDIGLAKEEELDQISLAKFKNSLIQNTSIPFDNTDKIKDIKYPLLFLHSTGDGIVPHKMTEDQFQLATNKQSKLVISEGSDPHFYRNWTFDYIKDFVDSIK